MKKTIWARMGAVLACLALCAGSASAETGGRWEKCDVSKDAELKKKLKDCPKEKRKRASKREKSAQRKRQTDGRDI